MRLFPLSLGLVLSLAACDLPDIGDSGSTTSGGDPGMTTVVSASETASATDPTDTTDPTTPTETAGGECPPFDPGPVGDPHEMYAYECMCETCELSFDDIPLETLQLFDSENLCECLCNQAGCGDVEGEGGVATGSPTTTVTETGPDPDCGDTEGGTTGWGGSSGGWADTEGPFPGSGTATDSDTDSGL